MLSDASQEHVCRWPVTVLTGPGHYANLGVRDKHVLIGRSHVNYACLEWFAVSRVLSGQPADPRQDRRQDARTGRGDVQDDKDCSPEIGWQLRHKCPDRIDTTGRRGDRDSRCRRGLVDGSHSPPFPTGGRGMRQSPSHHKRTQCSCWANPEASTSLLSAIGAEAWPASPAQGSTTAATRGITPEFVVSEQDVPRAARSDAPDCEGANDECTRACRPAAT